MPLPESHRTAILAHQWGLCIMCASLSLCVHPVVLHPLLLA